MKHFLFVFIVVFLYIKPASAARLPRMSAAAFVKKNSFNGKNLFFSNSFLQKKLNERFFSRSFSERSEQLDPFKTTLKSNLFDNKPSLFKTNGFSAEKTVQPDFLANPNQLTIIKIIDEKGEDFFIVETFSPLFFSALETKNRELLVKLLKAVRSLPFQEKIFTHIQSFMTIVLENQFQELLDEPFRDFKNLLLLDDNDDLLTEPDKFVIVMLVDFYGEAAVVEKYLPCAFSYALRTNNKKLLIGLIQSLHDAQTLGSKDALGNYLISLEFKNKVRISLEKKLTKQQQDEFYRVMNYRLNEFKNVSISEKLKGAFQSFKAFLNRFKNKYL